MRRGFLVLFTFILIGVGVYGAYYFSRLQKAESLVDQAIVDIQDGKYENARKTLASAIAQYDYGVVAAPSLSLMAECYIKEEKYQSAVQTFKTLLSDRRVGLTDRWSVQAVVALSRLYRHGYYPLSAKQTGILEDTLERIAERLEYRENAERSELLREIDALGERVRALSFTPLIKDVTRTALREEAGTELGFLYLSEKKYDRAEEVLSSLGTPVSRLGLAKLYVERGEEMKGIKLLEDLLDYDRTGGIRSYYLKEATEYGEALFREKRFVEALQVFEIVGRQADSLPYADLSLYYIAMYHYSTKRYDRALLYIDKILGNGVSFEDEEALLLKGFVYYDTRDFLRALKTFDMFIKKYPGSDQVHKAREWKAMSERSVKYLG
jgi:tetratricopeptide (TPR) repeat protein